MNVTWKKWACFLVATAVLGTGGHFLALRHLASIEVLWPAMAMDLRAHPYPWGDELEDGPAWDELLVEASLEWTYAPWPLAPLGPHPQPRPFDPDDPPTTDPEIIMGLALLGPALTDERQDRQAYTSQEESVHDELREWFYRLSALAVRHSDSPDMKRKFERIILYVRNAELHDQEEPEEISEFEIPPEPPETRPSPAPSPPRITREQIRARAAAIDPTNAVYLYDEALHEIEAITEDVEDPDSDERYRLKKDAELLPTARKVDALLSKADENCRIIRFRAYQRELVSKGWSFRYPSAPWLAPPFDAAALVIALSPDFSSRQRSLAKRLCFLGDRLTENGEDALALRMYRHAYRIGERLMGGTGEDFTILDTLIGQACSSLGNGRLMEYWAQRGNSEKVMEASEFNDHLNRRFRRISDAVRRRHTDPLGDNDVGFLTYLRLAGLTWWFALAAIVMTALSLHCAIGYMVCRRWRNHGATVIRLPFKALIVLGGVPVIAMVWVALLIPLALDTITSMGATVVWALIIVVGWAAAVGMLSRHTVIQAAGTRRSPLRWIWLGMGLAVMAGAVVGGVWGQNPVSLAAAIAFIGASACASIWIAAAIAGWVVRGGKSDRTYRAQVSKTFAVCSIFVAAVSLLAAIATIPLTRSRQHAYYESTRAQQRDEVGARLGEDWAESLEGLSPRMFLPDDPPPGIP